MIPRLLLLTDRAQLRLGRGLVDTVAECVDAGLTHVVVREHDLAPPARSALVAALAALPGLTVISSRIPDERAHGLHEPATPSCNAGFRSPGARRSPCEATITPRYSVRGRSCHSTAEVRRAAADGLDYVTLSPYADSPSKPGARQLRSAEEYVGHRLPVLALSGITPANASEAIAAGAHGVAVMGTVMRASEPADVVRQLLEVLP